MVVGGHSGRSSGRKLHYKGYTDRVRVSTKAQRRSLIMMLLLFVGRLVSQQHASVSQGHICSDNLTCCHTEIEVAD